MNQINARVISEPQWPNGGFAFSKMSERNYDINEFGQPVSTVPAGNWERGTIVRRYQPGFRPPYHGLESYDVTNPATWHQGER